MSKLTGKVAVVTGASKGIGAAIAKALAAEGASVVVNYASSQAGADDVVAAITAAGGKAVAAHGDVSKAAEAQGLIDAAIAAFGRLDILVNNSGVYEFGALGDITEDQFHKMFNVNVLGLLLTTQAAAKHFGEGASVINIGSAELGARKIRVNTINPGMVETEGTHTAGFIGSEFQTAMVGQTPLGRIGRPDDIADIAVFLASNDSRWLTGEQLVASGGLR
jgi:3-oxoacyl-[acyl-carrier protein] reductase